MTRPAGVTAIAVLYIIGACFMVLLALGLIIGGSLAGGALGSMIGGSQSTSGTGAAAWQSVCSLVPLVGLLCSFSRQFTAHLHGACSS
jgi:hypothetical protein